MFEPLPKAFISGVSDYNAVLWTMRWELTESYFIIIFIIVLSPLKQKNMFCCWLFMTLLLLFMVPAIAAFCMGLLISYIFTDKKSLCLTLQNKWPVKAVVLTLIPVLCLLVAVSNKFGLEKNGGALEIITAALAVGSLTFIKSFQIFFSKEALINYSVCPFYGVKMQKHTLKTDFRGFNQCCPNEPPRPEV
jgi:hypothetical protein